MVIAEHHVSCQHGWDNTPITGRTNYTQTGVTENPDNERVVLHQRKYNYRDQNTQEKSRTSKGSYETV